MSTGFVVNILKKGKEGAGTNPAPSNLLTTIRHGFEFGFDTLRIVSPP